MKDKTQSSHHYKVKAYHADTDTYGVVWHGAYLRWLEAGRIEVLEMMGIKFPELEGLDIMMPVVELNIRYKRFARAYDELSITTRIEGVGKAHLTFNQEIKNINTGELVLTATVKGVTTSREGKLFRVLPEYIRKNLDK